MHSTPKSFDGFLDEFREGVLARRRMKQDILQLRSGCQRRGFNVPTTPSEEYPDTEMWSSANSTTTAGIMTPTEPGSDGHDEPVIGYDEDRALENLLRTANRDLTQKDLARLVFHWTNVGVFGGYERHELTNSF
jgi:hypothetical protein